MDKKYTENDFMAKWANKTADKKDIEAFEGTEDHAQFEAILNGVEVLDVPPFDKEKIFEKIQAKRTAHHKTIPLFPKWVYVAAASVALLLGSILFFNNTVKHATSFGEQLAIALPDGSEVLLNSKSSITYNKGDWKKQRELTLDGEAFFKVTKGSSFTVNTVNGTVTVLGTQFTTSAHPGFFEVVCYEGSVKVEGQQKSEILNQGEAVRIIDGTLERWIPKGSQPSWMQGESTFVNAPLPQVLKALELQYGIAIENNVPDLDKMRFSGSFGHQNLNNALKSVLNPLEITFNQIDAHTIVLQKN